MKQYVSKFSGKELDERLTRVDDIPTKTSELNNDSGFISEAEADNKYTDKNKTDVLEEDIENIKNNIDDLKNNLFKKETFEIDVIGGYISRLHLPKKNTIIHNLYENTEYNLHINIPFIRDDGSKDGEFIWKIIWDGEGNLEIQEVNKELLLPEHFEIYQYIENTEIPTKISQLENDKNYIDEETFTTTLENDYVIKDDVYAVADGLRDSDDTIFYLPTTAPKDTDRMLLTQGSLKTINGESIVGSGNMDLVELSKFNKAVDALSKDIDILTGTGEGSVIDIANKEVAKVIDSAPETMDTLKKIADLIEKDAEQAADILATLGDHETRIDTLENRIVVLSETEYENLTKKEDKFYFCYEE